MPDEETREEPEVEGHGITPGDAAGTSPGADTEGTSPGVADDEDDVEAHMFGEGVSPGGTSPGGTSPGGTSPG
ncbi:MAG TPA: hypothetical protein VFR38_01750 [Gaiellaceae bacterium]|nr:hypothetical protein [Gaiellaceae bacterium]